MELSNNFDFEDWEIFQSSLRLLHSPEINSHRKLYHLLEKSIHKHHPKTKGGHKNIAHTSKEIK